MVFVYIAPPLCKTYDIFGTIMIFINNGFYACKGIHSDTFHFHALVLLSSKDLQSTWLGWHKYFIILAP